MMDLPGAFATRSTLDPLPLRDALLIRRETHRSVLILVGRLSVSALKLETLPFTIKAFSGTSLWSHRHMTRDRHKTAMPVV